MTLTFLQGQAIYQMLHILVSITQPIVERGYFSRFIWPSRGGRLFLLNTPSPRTQLGITFWTDAPFSRCYRWQETRSSDGSGWAVQLRASSRHRLSISVSCPSSGFVLLTDVFQWQTQSIIPRARSFIHLKLYNDEESSIPLSIHFSPASPFYLTFLISSSLSPPHTLCLHISSLSLTVVEWW